MKLAGQERPAYFLYHTLWNCLDLLFPPTCGGCGKTGIRWCKTCQEVSQLSGTVCPRCGEPQSTTQLCPDCQAAPPSFEAIRSYGIFRGPIREAVHRLKYKNDIGIAEALSKHLIELYNDLKWEIDLVTPVPLSSERAKKRGYNQAGLLSRPLAYAIDKPYQPGALARTRETRTQVGLNAAERRLNVQNAFSSKPGKVKGKVVLVIDDVMTTGSTINACAQALLQAGASAVYGLTVARASQQADANDQPITYT